MKSLIKDIKAILLTHEGWGDLYPPDLNITKPIPESVDVEKLVKDMYREGWYAALKSVVECFEARSK